VCVHVCVCVCGCVCVCVCVSCCFFGVLLTVNHNNAHKNTHTSHSPIHSLTHTGHERKTSADIIPAAPPFDDVPAVMSLMITTSTKELNKWIPNMLHAGRVPAIVLPVCVCV